MILDEIHSSDSEAKREQAKKKRRRRRRHRLLLTWRKVLLTAYAHAGLAKEFRVLVGVAFDDRKLNISWPSSFLNPTNPQDGRCWSTRRLRRWEHISRCANWRRSWCGRWTGLRNYCHTLSSNVVVTGNACSMIQAHMSTRISSDFKSEQICLLTEDKPYCNRLPRCPACTRYSAKAGWTIWTKFKVCMHKQNWQAREHSFIASEIVTNRDCERSIKLVCEYRRNGNSADDSILSASGGSHSKENTKLDTSLSDTAKRVSTVSCWCS